MAVKFDALLGQIREDYWKRQPGGIKHSGHIATADADVDTVSPLLTIAGNTLNAAANNFLNTTQISQTIQTPTLNTLLVDAPSNNGNTYVGQDGLSQIKSGNTSNYTGGVYGDVGAIYHTGSGAVATAAGVLGQVQLNGPGAITNAVALYGLALHLGSGSITTAADIYGRHIYWPGNSISVTDQYGFYVDTPIKVGGTATNNYGLYIGDQSGFATTLNYNLYSAGASSTNYLAGYVGIGGTSTSAKLHVDSTASAISGLVVKAQTNQYTFEYQKSDGTNLLRGVWDTGNFHHYLGGPLYYNLGGNNFVIDGNGYSNTGLIITGIAGTNKTHVLLGTSTIPSGTWGIYQASTETNFFSGDINFVKETARTIQIADTTTAATAGAALTLLGAKGSNTTSGAGGAINITGGDGRQGNSAGGAVNHTGGTGVGLAAGGAVNIKGGNGFIGGNILIDVGGGFAGAVMKIGSVNATPIAIGNITPTAYLHFKAGAAAASSAPLKFTAGTNLTTAEAGAVEYDNTFYMTQSDATRRQVVLATNATKTTGGAPYTNDGYITVRIGGTDVKLMTTA